MSRWLAMVLVASCGVAPAPAPQPPATPVERPAAATGERSVFRQLRVGKLPIARRTTFELILDGNRASLVEIDERERRALSMAEADRAARWMVVAQRTYRGSATIAPDAILLALASDGVQPLQLHCTRRAVNAAAAGAMRVPTPDRPADYECGDRGVWQPPTRISVSAMVCDAGVADPDDDDDLLVFAPPPGVEYASVNDDCVVKGGGLRVAR